MSMSQPFVPWNRFNECLFSMQHSTRYKGVVLAVILAPCPVVKVAFSASDCSSFVLDPYSLLRQKLQELCRIDHVVTWQNSIIMNLPIICSLQTQ